MAPSGRPSDPPSYPLRRLEGGREYDILNGESIAETEAFVDSPNPIEGLPFIHHLPQSAALDRLFAWLKGPPMPRPYVIVPFGQSFQTVPLKFIDSCLPQRSRRIWLLLGVYAVWVVAFIWVIRAGPAGDVNRTDSPILLSCISRFWPSTDECGLNGEQCRPFQDRTITFRCPVYCRDVKVLNTYAVGAEEIIYQSLVVGGPTKANANFSNIYRGDSFICAAAVHAGIINDRTGGCGTATLIGTQKDFLSSESGGIRSVGFDSSFPLSFTFTESSTLQPARCIDPQWQSFWLCVICTSILSVFTTSTVLFFGTIFVGAFFQTAVSSDPPYFPTYDSVVSAAFERFLPAAFVAYFIYHCFVRYTLRNFKAPIEKTVLWLGACWVGAIGNHTFDKIPILRLTPHDLKQQPGAIPALILIVLLVGCIAVVQAWAFRIEGRLIKYLGIYASLGLALGILLTIPRLHLRIHHYILALLLLPGTKLQTRPSLIYQGFLVGLFINGVARWGFASVLQTDTALRTDEKLGSLLPTVPTPTITGDNTTFSLRIANDYDGISALVNDVERFRVYGQGDVDFVWSTTDQLAGPEYFRFGFVKYDKLGGALLQDYTKAGIRKEDGTWVEMLPGPS